MKNKMGAMIYALFIIFFILVFTSRFDQDSWFLLNSGRFVEQWGIPHIEPFTIHHDFHFVMHQWLFALGLWKLYKLGGMPVLMVYAWFMSGLFLWMFYKILKLQISTFTLSVRVFLLFWLFLLCQGYMSQRPQTVSGLIFLLEIYFLEKYASQTQMPRLMIPLFFLLSVLLVNFHGAMWPMFAVFLLPYTFEAIVGPHLSFGKCELAWKTKDFLFLFAAVLTGGFCGPYGIESMTYAFKSYGYTDINLIVGEMHPLSLNFASPYQTIFLLVLFACAICYGRNSLPFRHQLLALGTGFMTLQANRSGLLFLLAGMFPLAKIIAKASFKQNHVPYSWSHAHRMIFLMLAGSIVVIIILFSKTPIPVNRMILFYGAFIILGSLSAYSFKILWENRQRAEKLRIYIWQTFAFLGLTILFSYTIAVHRIIQVDLPLKKSVNIIQKDSAGTPICLWTGYNDGPYAEFQGIPCYLDTRAEVFKPKLNHKKDVMLEYCSLLYNQLDYRDFVTRYPFTHFLTTDLDPLYVNLKNDPRFELLWDSEEDDEIQEKATELEKRKKVRVYKWRH